MNVRLWWGLSVLLLHAASGSAASRLPTRTTEQPTGLRAGAVKTSAGLNGEPPQLIGRCATGAWPTLVRHAPIAGDQRLNLEKSTLELTDKTLRGAVSLRTATGRGRPLVSVTARLDLTVSGISCRGTTNSRSRARRTSRARVPRPGCCNGARPRPTRSIRARLGRRSLDRAGDMAADQQPALITDLNQARPVCAQRSACPDGLLQRAGHRYFHPRLITGNGGRQFAGRRRGPRVYGRFTVPEPGLAARAQESLWERSYADDAAFQHRLTELHATPQEQASVRDHFRPLADDHVVALDGGRARRYGARSCRAAAANLQTHKHRGTSVCRSWPMHGDVPNLASRLYALDAATGEVKWDCPTFDGTTKPQNTNDGPHFPSPLLVGQN